ncbi:MAG: hypothetical protein ACKO8G_01225 [Actinomycetota bacterium]
MNPRSAMLVFLAAAFVSFVLSVGLWFGVIGGEANREAGMFVGLWVPSILSLGNLLAPRGRA